MSVKEKSLVPDNIVMVLKDAATGRVKQVVRTRLDGSHNIVTNAGEHYYAQRAAGSTASLSFVQMTVASSIRAATANATFGDFRTAANVSTVPTGGTQTIDTGYPTTSDSDADNTGADSNVVTWLRTYSTTQANTVIRALAINQNTAAATPGAQTTTQLLLNASALAASVTKTSSDTLRVFVNHTFTGV
jgi:hypothetical protein